MYGAAVAGWVVDNTDIWSRHNPLRHKLYKLLRTIWGDVRTVSANCEGQSEIKQRCRMKWQLRWLTLCFGTEISNLTSFLAIIVFVELVAAHTWATFSVHSLAGLPTVSCHCPVGFLKESYNSKLLRSLPQTSNEQHYHTAERNTKSK